MWEACSVSYVSWDWDGPQQGIEAKDLFDIVEVAEGPAFLVTHLVVKDGASKLL